jgi:hypothetical protein
MATDSGEGFEGAATGGLDLSGSRGGELAGPWLAAFWVLLPIQLRSKSNFRRGTHRRWGTYRGFEEELAVEMRRFLPDGWITEEPNSPLPTRPRYASVIAARSVIDAGNFSKSVLDACEGVVFTNDAQVQVTTALADRSKKEPYVLVAFAQLAPSTPCHEAARAVSSLLDACVEIITPVQIHAGARSQGV